MIHTSINVRATWEYKVRGSAGVIKYLLQFLQEAGYVTHVVERYDNERVITRSVESTSIYIGADKLWEVVIYSNPAPMYGGPSTEPLYILWYHPPSGREIDIGTVDNITLVMAVISTTAEFS